jgi:hypothetical protein
VRYDFDRDFRRADDVLVVQRLGGHHFAGPALGASGAYTDTLGVRGYLGVGTVQRKVK